MTRVKGKSKGHPMTYRKWHRRVRGEALLILKLGRFNFINDRRFTFYMALVGLQDEYGRLSKNKMS